MKKTKTLYWIFTGLIAAFMGLTSIQSVMVDAESVKFLHDLLGFPVYMIPFLGVAKIVGSIALLIPGFPRIKEWAYAGLAFDLVGALYAVTAVAGVGGGTAFISLAIVVLALSYYFYHKMIKE
ncbi:MAG TPA: DoxX family protein [Cytophagaceae bacterium]|jgi:hypothetical protein|nr:DoxX family protein [Cytophagaceae bacterium]